MPTTPPAEEPLTTLRGAGVEVDTARLGRLLAGVVLVGVAVAAVVLAVSGSHRNDQIDQLRRHGVPVTFRITGCTGELGGSGSNAAGYRCAGTYRMGGRTYRVGLPGDGQRVAGSTVAAIAVPGRPSLVETAAAVARERTSRSYLILPIALLLADAALAMVLRHRQRRQERRRGGV